MIIGDKEDIEYVVKNVPLAGKLVGVFRPSPEAIKNVPLASFSMVFLPCFWPHLILLSPCLIGACFASRATLKETYYILTTDSLIYHVSDPSIGFCSTGLDSKEFSLQMIQDVTINNAGSGCALFQVPSVKIGMINSSRKTRPFSLYVSNTTELAMTIQQLKKQLHPAILNYPFQYVPQMTFKPV